MRSVGWIVVIATLFACQQNTSSTSVTEQEKRVEIAATGLAAEKLRLESLRDSLEFKVSQNIELGMTAQQARATESAMLEVQMTVVKASEINLDHQKELLALMKDTPK